MNAGSRSWRAETFTRIVTGVALQAAAWRHASRITHAPIGTISPVSSATAMKSPGARRPSSVCCQRSSASTACTRPEARSTSGW
jgi:hypothetical protein